ncbi:uncharacterized protein V1510DRAFT_401549 [Dipodascopsis tothii]|uniref:uncharacterized protein n=1 Tax=Dipodascopsis tothii TaxID=44089 RepID=UPI0034CFF927
MWAIRPLSPVQRALHFVAQLGALLAEVVGFWYTRLVRLLTERGPEAALLERLHTADTYDAWLDAALELDRVQGNDVWRQNPQSSQYDYRLISQRLDLLRAARDAGDVVALVTMLRSGLFRNLGNIASKQLFTHTGTKHLIEQYNAEVVAALHYVLGQAELTPQHKFDIVHDTRQSFGVSTLVLQGGILFGLCHLGVVRVLYQHRLLPRIISGAGVGALIATLVCVHKDSELVAFLDGKGIDLEVFRGRAAGTPAQHAWRRLLRFLSKGYVLDMAVLEQCVRDNIDDLTFEEAYARTRRVLNIAVNSTERYVPTLFNYLTTPNVLIRTAACASNALPGLYEEVTIMCKDEFGHVVPWIPSGGALKWKSWADAAAADRDAPYTRLSELFNVNHFIVSQARPYMTFMSSDLMNRSSTLNTRIVRVFLLEVHHRLAQLDYLNLLPRTLRRVLALDDIRLLPSTSSSFGSSPVSSTSASDIVTVIPDVDALDFWKLLAESPTSSADVEYWSRKGERSMWFALPLVRERCSIEMLLDGIYDAMVRRTR